MEVDFPKIARVRQTWDQPELDDPRAATEAAIAGSGIRTRVKPGGRVAITAGSRGIRGIDVITRAAAATLRRMGFEPFVVAAMGSHGGATRAGQRDLLAELGVTEESVGCPIRCELETVGLGTNSFGLPIHFDKNAYESDGIVLINRVKPHTSFTGRYESGLLKMLTIGLGKLEGAAQVHKLGLPGLKAMLPEVGSRLLESTPVALGLAILENAREATAEIVAVEPEDLLEVEPRLLDRARGYLATLPFDSVDVLVVGEIGKNYSGTGMDPNVIGRQRIETMPDLPRPIVTRLVVLDVAPEANGNGLGIGLADLTTERLVARLDREPIRVNSLTSNFLSRARIPITLSNDRECLSAALDTCWKTRWSDARAVFIPNTLELETLWVTRPLSDEVSKNPALRFESEFVNVPIGAGGTLDQPRLFPSALCSRRRNVKK